MDVSSSMTAKAPIWTLLPKWTFFPMVAVWWTILPFSPDTWALIGSASKSVAVGARSIRYLHNSMVPVWDTFRNTKGNNHTNRVKSSPAFK
jgi:hypothetical protein